MMSFLPVPRLCLFHTPLNRTYRHDQVPAPWEIAWEDAQNNIKGFSIQVASPCLPETQASGFSPPSGKKPHLGGGAMGGGSGLRPPPDDSAEGGRPRSQVFARTLSITLRVLAGWVGVGGGGQLSIQVERGMAVCSIPELTQKAQEERAGAGGQRRWGTEALGKGSRGGEKASPAPHQPRPLDGVQGRAPHQPQVPGTSLPPNLLPSGSSTTPPPGGAPVPGGRRGGVRAVETWPCPLQSRRPLDVGAAAADCPG